MIDPNKVSYSSTVSFFYKPKDLDIRRIYTISTSSNLQAEINSQKKQSVNIEIINTLGMSVFQQSQNLTAGINTGGPGQSPCRWVLLFRIQVLITVLV
ncbi:MAG: hypothetical protein IPI78_07900 [Chitinophagaceae bacterium]|nr:hypothetical protein [Chitinophagaceae bacterium]